MSKSLNTRVALRNDTASAWATENPTLLKGEMGIEIDTLKFKFGDSLTEWNDLPYASASAAVVKTVNPTTNDKDYDIGTLWINTTADTIFVITDNSSTAIWKNLATSADLALKQNTLVSGTNIKTINNTSVLGSGNIEIPIGATVYEKTTAPTTSDYDGYEVGDFWIYNDLYAIITRKKYIYFLIYKALVDGVKVATWRELIASGDTVENAINATKLSTARTIGLTGDATGSTSFDGSANKTIAVVLKNSGVTAGTYTKLTVDAKGIVTSATQITSADVPTLPTSKITGLGTAATKNVGTASGNVVGVNSNGKIDESLLPAIAITETFVVASQTAMLALNAQIGDVAIRTDQNKSYILQTAGASTLSHWQVLLTPTDTVLSVNNKTGAVTLTTTDIAEGNKLYYTEARATANFNTNFPLKSSKALTDGDQILRTEDFLILDCGGAVVE